MGEHATMFGAAELAEELKKLGLEPNREPFRKDLLKAGRWLRDSLRKAGPKGRGDPGRIRGGKAYRGGNLRKGIIAGKKFGRRFPFDRNTPTIYVGVHYRIAPHMNFIERGARLSGSAPAIAGIRQGKGEKAFATGKKALRLYGIKRKVVFAAYAYPGPMQPKPFFRKTVDATRPKVEEFISISAWNRIKGVQWEYIKPSG